MANKNILYVSPLFKKAVTAKEIAWIAGILEGEGSFSFRERNGCACIALQMTDKDVVERVRDIMWPSRSVRENSRPAPYKGLYLFMLTGISAIQWMMTILPLMGSRRRKQIMHALIYWRWKMGQRKRTCYCANHPPGELCHRCRTQNERRIQAYGGKIIFHRWMTERWNKIEPRLFRLITLMEE